MYHNLTVLRLPLIGMVLLLLMVGGCSRTSESHTGVRVFAGISPLAYLAERIGGDQATVEVLLPPGQSPHSYDPSPRQVARLAEAGLLFIVGVPFELRLAERLQSTASHPTVIDTRLGIELLPIDGHHHPGEGATDSHDGESLDPHIWLSPRLAGQIAATVTAAFKQLDGDHASVYDANLAALLHDLDSVDTRLRALLAPVQGGEVYVFHPAYGYFLREYGLKQVAVEVEGKEPAIKDLVDLLNRAHEHRITTLFVQPQFSASQAQTIADHVGAEVAVLDPLANDYLDNLLAMGQAIRTALDHTTGVDGTERSPR